MPELSPIGTVLLFLIGSMAFVSVTLLVGKMLRPNRPNEQKLSTYESGEEPVGSAWGRFNPRFYIIALVFILFEAELIFLFPWAVVFGDAQMVAATSGSWGWLALGEMFFFLLVLALGLAWVWREGLLEWVKPEVRQPKFKGKVPMELYRKFNEAQK